MALISMAQSHSPNLSSNISCKGQKKETGRSAWSNYGCSIYAHPSDGSIIIKDHADIVDMTFLGFNRMAPPKDRFKDNREDMFAKLLLKAGGTRWSSIAHWKYSMIANTAANFDERVIRVFGWPGINMYPTEGGECVENGVWVIEDTWQARFDTDDESYLADDPVVEGKLRMALDMEERIEVMKELGAEFFPDARQAPGLGLAYDPEWSGSKGKA